MGCVFSKETDDGGIEYDMSPIRALPVIFVNGVPGAGNRTVAQTISDLTGYAMVRPGELLRAESAKDTTRGRLLAAKMRAREDIPEQLTLNLIKEAMLLEQHAKGFILVGFPRNPRLSSMFNRQIKWPEKVVALQVDDEVATSRLQSRLSELGRPAAEVRAARRAVRGAARGVRGAHRRLGAQLVTVDSSGNPTALASTLKEILSDMVKDQKEESEEDVEEETSSTPKQDTEEERQRVEAPEVVA